MMHLTTGQIAFTIVFSLMIIGMLILNIHEGIKYRRRARREKERPAAKELTPPTPDYEDLSLVAKTQEEAEAGRKKKIFGLHGTMEDETKGDIKQLYSPSFQESQAEFDEELKLITQHFRFTPRYPDWLTDENGTSRTMMTQGELRTRYPGEAQKLQEQYSSYYQSQMEDFKKRAEQINATDTNDIAPASPTQGNEDLPSGESYSYMSAYKHAFYQYSLYDPDYDIKIEGQGNSYRWRLVRRDSKVELPCKKVYDQVIASGIALATKSNNDMSAGSHYGQGTIDQYNERNHDKTITTINDYIQKQKAYTGRSVGKISDGFHTFDELYEMRLALTVALFNALPSSTYKSKLHHDETMFDGYFIVGMVDKGKQITFHYKIDQWDSFPRAKVLDKAPEWDGHTDKDVIERLKSL